MEILLATFNEDKLREIRAIAENYLHGFISLKDWCEAHGEDYAEVPETGKTFSENSLIKARAAFKRTGLPSLADDTGLMVLSLGGAPGIFSARYAISDEEKKHYKPGEIYSLNRKKLIEEMRGVKNREAFFICSVTLCFSETNFLSAEGKCSGEIAMSDPETDGFGYDPIFLVNVQHDKKSNISVGPEAFSQLTMEEKNRISHRGIALRNIFENFTGICGYGN